MNRLFCFLFISAILFSCDLNKDDKKNEFIPNLTDLNNNEFKLENYEGNVLIVNLWATWCKPCVAEFESLEKFKKKVIGKKIKIVAISNENKDKIKAFIEKRNFDLEFIKLNGDLTYFNAYSLPTTIILDKKGNESFRIASGIDFTSNNFVDKILALEEL
ncbi:MAG: TlpA disulfide reductase family protein [Bacteroidota bacterium]|nr:TlpA disulfide reductase family protein [Bacteroidota bacterium]